MKKKLLSGFLAFVFALQIFIFDTAYAKEINTSTDNLITVGKLSKEDYPEIDSATLLRVAKENREKLKGKKMEKGASLFSTKSPYINGQQPADPDKPKYWANVQGKLTTSGIDGSTFDWDKVIGKGQKVKLLFTQTNGNVMTGITYSLLVDKEGTYTWQASDGKPTYLPLYDVDGKPYTYNVQIERNYSKDIQLIVQESNGTPKAKFRQEGDKQVATISFLDIGIQQVASTKFVSEWHTDLAEADRPQIEGYYKANDDADNNFNFPKNDTTRTILRYSFLENFEEDEDNDQWAFISDELETTPKTVEVKTDTQGLKFEEKNGVKTVKSGEHKFKYDFTYDVIDGGKLTMTEIIPIAFNANGGKFASITDENAEQKIVKEVEYDGTLTDVAEEPTKEKESFKGWSLTKDGDPLSDVEINKAIKNIKEAKTFYAIYGKAGAKIIYLDLNGKKIDDKFKLDEVDYPKEKEGKTGDPIIKGDYTAKTAPKFIGYKFNRVELNPVDAKYGFDKKDTIKLYYEKLPDVIPEKDESGNPNEKPAGYVEVKFVPTDKATDETMAEKIYWVNPDKKVTIPVTNPVGKQYFTFKEWKLGADAKGDKYTPSTPKKFETATTITATYKEAKNIIPYDPNEPTTRPDGYVRVTFAADTGLKLTKEKAYYVKKNAGITLGNEELVKPAYEEETGYKFDKWDKEDSLVIEAADIVVTAKATKLDNVIPEKDDNDNPNDKPDGYKEVTFVVKTGDEAKGSINGVAKFYVNPTEYVKINPPATNANTGFEFGTWDKDATISTVYDKDTTITGSFNGLKDLIPKTNPDGSENKPPKGYKKVTFVIDPATGGKIADGEVTVYYVNPAKEVTVPQPNTQAETGYEFKKWDQDTSKAKKYTEDTTVKGNFKKLKDIIPSTDEKGNPNAQPEGYVTVTFDKGANGKSIKGQTVYYVNPKAGKTLAGITKPKVSPETGYEADGWDKKDSQSITEDLTVTAKYKEIDDVIPKTKEDDSEKPEGYITVTFVKGEHGKLEGNTTFYVNPNKAVVLEGKAPKINPNTGFTSAGWDTSINKAIQYKDGDKITAQYNKKDDVIPQKDPKGKDKPAGYLTVTFLDGGNGKLSGKTVYYVNPDKEVTVPAPTVKPNTGYVFDKWDKALTQTFKENTTITAQYDSLENIIPGNQPKPDGYFTVKFEAKNGSLQGTTIYYVNPNVAVDLTNTADAITKNPNLGYTADGGTWVDAIVKKMYEGDQTYTFKFEKLDDIIPETDKNGKHEKPAGYVTVKFATNDSGSLEGNTIYYVNPKAGKTMEDKDIIPPRIHPNAEWELKTPNWNPATEYGPKIEEDRVYSANYNALCEAKIIYKPNNLAWGSVNLGEENIKNNKELKGSTATAKESYEFEKWTDIDGKEVSKDPTFKPSKKVAAVYIAVFKKKATDISKVGSLTITKKLESDKENTTSEKTKFKFEVTGPNDYKKEFELEAGASKTLNKLAYGDYYVKETDSKGYTPYYALNGGAESTANNKVTIDSGTPATLIVTNKKEKPTNPDDEKIDVVAYKKWVGVPDGVEKPKIMFQLKRIVANKKAENVGAPVPVTGKADEHGLIKVDFGKQAAKNDENYFYSYFVIELDENGNKFNHKNYKRDYSSNFLTITNIYQAGGSSVTPTPNPNPQPNPEPTPNPQPNPEPNPNPEPTPNPQPNPEPNPNPEPTPNPQPNPEPNPNPQPNPEPTPNPQPDPEPTPNPQPNPEPTPNPQPDPETTPNPQPDPEPTPNPQPDPEPIPNPQPDPEPTPNPQPDPEPTPNPQVDQKTKPDTKLGSDSKNKDGNKKVSNSFAKNKAKKAPGTGVEDTTFATYALTISSALLGLFMKKKKK